MAFDVLVFLAEHNITNTPFFAGMSLQNVARWYDAVAHRTSWDMSYNIEFEEPDMFGDDAPLDLRNPDPTDHGEQDQWWENDLLEDEKPNLIQIAFRKRNLMS